MTEAELFKTFCDALIIKAPKRSTIASRCESIAKRLNKDFWNMDCVTGSRYVGSYGRNTANDWVSDIDMVFEMPISTYNQYDKYTSNGQSSLLQAVKNSIATTYPDTEMKGDGQIVQVKFTDKMKFEVLPVWLQADGSYVFADSNGGGSWKRTNPIPEISAIASGDADANGNLRNLCRMVRAWKHYCSVPIKGLLIDTLAYRFISSWAHREQSYLYYDYMSRDFFAYLKDQPKDQTSWYAVGSLQTINNPENFRYKATVAHNNALEAISLLSSKKEWSAKQKWIDIYGCRFPA